jgi:hypothetical protein
MLLQEDTELNRDLYWPGVLVLVLDQTDSISIIGAQRGIDVIDETTVSAIGYVTFGDVVCQIRPITTDLAAVRAELVSAIENPGVLPFYCDAGGGVAENGIDALAAGLDLIEAYTGIPGVSKALYFKTDNDLFIPSSADPEDVNTRLNNLAAVWLDYGPGYDDGTPGHYSTVFPETDIVSHSNLPIPD